MNRIASLLIATLVLAGCSSANQPPAAPAPPPGPTVTDLKAPTGAGSESPGLTTGPDGQTYLSWVETADDGSQSLRFATRSNGDWSAPQTVAKGTDWFVSAVDAPSVTALPDGTLAASWFTATEIEKEAYDTKVAFSTDKGATWGKPVSPHRDKKKRQHGFLSMIPTGANQLAAVWLDGKNLPEDLIGDMALLSTTISTDGKLGSETQLDGRACECCHTSMAVVPDGLVVVYRDRTEKEIRDISIVRYSNGAWSQPEPLSSEGWEIDGCPVNGPSVASNGPNVAAAWFSAPKDVAQVNMAMSTDGGKTFGKVVRIDEGNPIGQVDVVSLSSGAALVSWLERTGDGAKVRMRQIDAGGAMGMPIAVSSVNSTSESVPQIERAGNDIVAVWTDSDRNVHTTLVEF